MKKEFEYIHNNECYKVFVTYKSIRRIHYHYRKEGFVISAPYLTSKKTIFDGLDKFADYLLNAYKKSIAFDDTNVYIFGKCFNYKDNTQITFTDGTVIKYSSYDELIKKLKPYYKKIITSRVRYYEEIMNTQNHNVKIRDMKTRLGTNSKKTHSITISTSLIHFAIPIIDSVIVHEIAHDYHFDHSKNFYNVLLKYCPEYWTYRKKILKGDYVC